MGLQSTEARVPAPRTPWPWREGKFYIPACANRFRLVLLIGKGRATNVAQFKEIMRLIFICVALFQLASISGDSGNVWRCSCWNDMLKKGTSSTAANDLWNTGCFLLLFKEITIIKNITQLFKKKSSKSDLTTKTMSVVKTSENAVTEFTKIYCFNKWPES